MTSKTEKNIYNQIIFIGKATGALLLLLTITGTLIWQLYAQELVKKEVKYSLLQHEGIAFPKIKRNTEDIAQLKDMQLLVYLSIKKLLTEDDIAAAKTELEEIKRRQ